MKNTFYSIVILLIVSLKLNAQTTTVIAPGSGLDEPNHLAIDGDSLYIADYYANTIFKVNLKATTPTLITLMTGLSGPVAVAVKDSLLYIAESDADRISKINLLKLLKKRVVVATGLNDPTSIQFKGDGNLLYIAEYGAGQISTIDVASADINGSKKALITGLSGPEGILFNGNDLYIAEYFASRVSKIDVAATPIVRNSVIDVNRPIGLALIGNDLYITSTATNSISTTNIMDTNRTLTTTLTGLNIPYGIISHETSLYVAESNSPKITRVDASTLSLHAFTAKENIVLLPNPAKDFILVSNFGKHTVYEIYNILGKKIKKGNLKTTNKIEINGFNKGIYFLKFENGHSIKFIKN